MRLDMMPRHARRPLLIVMAIMVSGLATALPAAAQYWGGDRYYGGYGGYRHYRQGPQRDFFFPFSGFNRPPPVVHSPKAPATRTVGTRPNTAVFGIGEL